MASTVPGRVSATVSGCHRIFELLFQYVVAPNLAALVAKASFLLGTAMVPATVSACDRVLELLFQYLVALSLAALVAEAAQLRQ